MGKTRELFKKIKDTKGTFHAKEGIMKDWNGMDLTEAEDIKRQSVSCVRWHDSPSRVSPGHSDMTVRLVCQVTRQCVTRTQWHDSPSRVSGDTTVRLVCHLDTVTRQSVSCVTRTWWHDSPSRVSPGHGDTTICPCVSLAGERAQRCARALL